MKLHFLSLFDFILFFCVLLLTGFGIAFIYSSGINSSGISVSNEYIKQLIFAGTGIILMITTAVLDYRKFMRHAPKFFIGLVVILLYTVFFGKYVNGARSWLGIGDLGIQPSEFCKIIYIIFLAWYLERSDSVAPRRRFIWSLCIMLVPLLLILLQPDLGTASVYIPIFLVMCFMAGIPVRYLMMVFCAGLLTVVFTVLPVWEAEIARRSIPWIKIFTNDRIRFIIIIAAGSISLIGIIGNALFKNKYYYWIAYAFGIITFALAASIAAAHVLKPYQIKRLIVFIDPNCDPLGAGWNIIQSKVAIGSGNLFGQGFLNGTQSHYRFLPQQSTDFIFSILSEEWGFLGSAVVFFVYFIMLFRIIVIIRNTKNLYGYYISSGILAMFFFHFVVNVGMVMGIMPITGIPLLFLSYGGSSLWTGMICVGLLMSINFRQMNFSY
ncbi:rod shape-determining protein RodA [Treponema brennaborense]|uniref:Peptidoglycan glycosyltransferase RodA n=1 Tax=Treponema brennaborense (strain DSM 12168 / CIP 105900 / DD5/3) TaxID=906968 RepID=F4LMN2_TREBD|nr:rod shape-determining protein RodA [Treponema brennaborense]AEE16779.1 rod shape-determining protein RodA [Treponema brennaborense DSM 12168]